MPPNPVTQQDRYLARGAARRPRPAKPRRRARTEHSARREPVETEVRIACTVEAADRMADRVAHPLHLVLAPLVQRQLDPAPARPPAEDTNLGRSGRAVVELDARTKPGELVPRRRALDLHLVHLRHAVAGVREPVGELPVVREQERARRIHVEAADRNHTRLGWDEPGDGRATVWVARGRHDAGRLVQEDVGEGLPLDALAVDLDDVPSPDVRVQLARLPVDADATRTDELVGPPARDDTRPGQERVQAHGEILARFG